MHYKNGRVAHEGDHIVYKQSYDGKVFAGRLQNTMAKADTCNGQLVYPNFNGNVCMTVTIGECLHADDAWPMDEADYPAKEE